jgi:hypothetical protein
MAIGPAAAGSMPSRKCIGCYAEATPTWLMLTCRNTWIVFHTAPRFMRLG